MLMLRKRIERIGGRMIKCSIRCKRITNKPYRGIVPRCLVLEGKGREGCVVVGINPGQARLKEKQFFKEYLYNSLALFPCIFHPRF